MMPLRWRKPPPRIVTQWRGPSAASVQAQSVLRETPLAAIIGPPGQAGPAPLTGQITLILPSGIGSLHAEQSFPAPGVKPAMRAFAALEMMTDDDENCPEFLCVAAIAARAEADSITVSLSLTEAASGHVSLIWSAF